MNEVKSQNFEATRKSPVLELEERIRRYSRVSHYVMITGERGTGKTTIAKKLHQQSARAKREFVNLNCASLTQELLESELFGHEKGAFTGAIAPKMGLFEIANGGTLFLDEIGELPFNLQAKLLKAVEEKCIRRVGSNSERRVDARIITATSQNLRQMVQSGSFRPDLFDRLNILNLETVPLRRQKEKIRELLIKWLEKEYISIGRTKPCDIDDEAIDFIENQKWCGNFRELQNFTTRLAVECLDNPVISLKIVQSILRENSNNFPNADLPVNATTGNQVVFNDSTICEDDVVTVKFDPATDDLDGIYIKAAGNVIRHVLSENNGNLRRAARKMGATHSTLSRILKKFELRNSAKAEENLDSTPHSFAVAA